MTATDTEAALLAAIRENPGEDAPRLVYADWLEENGQEAWAEFIRVQVELASPEKWVCVASTAETVTVNGKRVPAGQIHVRPNRDRLREREQELWGYAPRNDGIMSMFGNTLPGAGFISCGDEGKHLGRSFPVIVVLRGLPSIVRCTLAEWMGEPCSQCSGRGHRTLYGDGSGPWAKCQYCVDGRTPGIGPRLAQRWPVVRVEVTYQTALHGSVDEWFMEETPPRFGTVEARLPWSIYRKLRGGLAGGWSKSYPTESAARAALSDALIAWARGQEMEEKR